MIAVAGPSADAAGRGSKLRAWRRLAAIVALLLPCVTLHYLWQALRLHSPWPRRFLRWATWSAGADVRITGRALTRDVLLIANHVSWLDILVLAGATDGRFVAKSEVAGWPVIGWLAGLSRTVYVARTERGRVQEQAISLSAAIAEHQPVVLFPEGGTGDGHVIGPFRASLLAAMTPPPPRAMLQPVVLDYGREAPIVAWRDDTGIDREALRILALPGRREVTIRFLDPIDPTACPDRKALAMAAREAMIAALGAGEAKRL